MLFLPRALAVRKSASSTANRPIAPPTGPNPPISGTNRKPTESEIIAGPSVTLSSNCQDTLIGPTHAVPTPKYYTSVSGHPSNTDPSYQHHVSDSAPQRIDVAQSLHSGCIVWLNGLPINQKITKPVISNLVEAIHTSAKEPLPFEVETSKEEPTDKPAKDSDVKYVDFTKGLPNVNKRIILLSMIIVSLSLKTSWLTQLGLSLRHTVPHSLFLGSIGRPIRERVEILYRVTESVDSGHLWIGDRLRETRRTGHQRTTTRYLSGENTRLPSLTNERKNDEVFLREGVVSATGCNDMKETERPLAHMNQVFWKFVYSYSSLTNLVILRVDQLDLNKKSGRNIVFRVKSTSTYIPQQPDRLSVGRLSSCGDVHRCSNAHVVYRTAHPTQAVEASHDHISVHWCYMQLATALMIVITFEVSSKFARYRRSGLAILYIASIRKPDNLIELQAMEARPIGCKPVSPCANDSLPLDPVLTHFHSVSPSSEQLGLPENQIFPSAFSRPHGLRKRNVMGAKRPSTSEGLLENFQVAQPPVVPKQGRSCSQNLLQTTFGNSYGKPARVSYSAPKDCGESSNWASVILKLTVTSRGNQFDRLGTVFLGGVEIMRTSTAEPTPGGITWTVEKDVTKYITLFALPEASLVMRIDNIIDEEKGIDGEFFVQLSATYYMATADFPASVSPAVIIPLSGNDSTPFSVPTAGISAVRIPPNAVIAAVEIYASGSEKEEYTNPLDQAIPVIDNTSNGNFYGKGSFREVQLWIDNRLAGVAYPFPVIFTGGMLLTWWRPMAAYGSLDQPTYQIDITPFLPLLTDSKSHNFTLTVEGQGENRSINSKWFLSGNIAITLDASGKRTTGEILGYGTTPTINVVGGICGVSVCTATDASRKLSIESYIVTGSNQKKKVSFKQDLAYQNKQILALDGNSQEVAQLSTGSSVSQKDSVVTFSDDFSFPLKVTLQNGQAGVKGDINLTYNRKLKPALKGLATSIQTTQIATGTLDLAQPDRSQGGLAQTGQIFFYTDERGSSFGRDLIVKNVTQTLKDVYSGTLAKFGP
ncbi:hypothetical protein KEM48_012838 [Puccinia striiformis f. sp. tritici PST-130]|nr:hypothetical protein KEM48_012838 [Puccinia striiformis f. sp. tritici PST-130]